MILWGELRSHIYYIRNETIHVNQIPIKKKTSLLKILADRINFQLIFKNNFLKKFFHEGKLKKIIKWIFGLYLKLKQVYIGNVEKY